MTTLTKRITTETRHQGFRGITWLLAAACLTTGTLGSSAIAQTPATIVSGLQRPAKIIRTPLGHHLVAEVGATGTVNTSRISIIEPDGSRRTLVDGLPSALSAAAAQAGVSGLYLKGRTLYVAIGEGNPTLRGTVPRTELPNPNPASPIFSSVLAVKFSSNVEKRTNGISLTYADHQALKAGDRLVNTDADGRKITIELVVDFPDYISEPVAGEPNNVRHSQPYGVVADDEYLYVVDGGYNRVHKAEIISGTFQTLVSFPNIINPIFVVPPPPGPPVGGPTVEVVPTSIHWNGDQLIATLLSGFPFPAGTSRVISINPETGATASIITGLTSAIDALPLFEDDALQGYLALEYSVVHLAGLPGRLRLFDSAGGSPVLLSAGLQSAAAMVYDRKKGKVIVALIDAGTLVSLDLP